MDPPYTKTRLQYALKVFREGREDTNPAPFKVQRHLRNDYQLRQVNAASNLLHATTWDDDDASSDEYNPGMSKRRRPVTSRTTKPKRSRQGFKPANPAHTSPEKIGADIGPFPSLVTLKLRSYHGRFLLDALAREHGTGYQMKSSDEDNGSREGGNDRRQSGMTFFEKQDEESWKIDEGINRSGLKRKIESPIKTQSCSACKQANKRCSAKVSGKFPCKRCESEYLKCVEYEISQDINDAETTKPEDALALVSTPSRDGPTQTSSAIGEKPIDELRRHFLDVEAMRGVHVASPGTSRQNPIMLDSPTPSPEPPELKHSPTFLISTPWGHPIEFKSKVTECHFCRDFRYGIYGYGLVKAEVCRMADGQLLEVADGHLSKGKAATRMCVICALKRLYVSRCKIHVVGQFSSLENARINKYMQQLLDEQYPRGPAIKSGVCYPCSLCAQPAFSRCVADQSYDMRRSRLSEEEGKGKGCGLLLCKSCAEKLQADGGLLTKTTVQKDSGHNCRRADMGFLFAGSLLHMAYK